MTTLVLAGTSEAKKVCQNLAELDSDVIASLAGVTRNPAKLAVKTRIGGFGGLDGFKDFCAENKITKILDATHPFASKMTQTALQVGALLDIPTAILQRQSWVATDEDDWHPVATIHEATKIVPEGANVFVGTGRQTLAELEILRSRTLLMRVIDPPINDFPYENGRYIVGKAPFSVEDEIALFQREKIDWLLVKNSGGEASFSKLAAARVLKIPVAMIKRPSIPRDAILFTETQSAMKWLLDA